jgi:hypothetical protein
LLFGLFISMMTECSNQPHQWVWYEVLPLEQKSSVAPSRSIDRGQVEAVDALRLAHGQKARLFILPQAIRRTLPALGNQFDYIIKVSALASAVGLQEVTPSGQ